MNSHRLWPATLAITCALFASAAHAQTTTGLTAQGTAAYSAKHYAESAALYRKALDLTTDNGDRSSLEYNLACDEALQGHTDAAFAALNQAISDGFGNAANTQSDPDLTSLHRDARWQALLTTMKTASTAQDARWGTAVFKTPFAPNLSDAEKLAGLSILWSQARYGFANFWHVPKLNWDKTYIDFIPQVTATKSTADYYRVLERFYALLQDGHSGVYPPSELNIGRVPLATELIDGHVIVTGSSDPSFDMQGLQPGDEILTVNGQPVIAWATANVLPYVTASSQQDRDSRTYRRQLFESPVGAAFTLTTVNPGGKQSTHTFTATPWKYVPPTMFAYRMLPGNIAYVALNGFDDDTAAREWDKHWPEISQAKALILDLRENGGGDDSVGAHILATLLNAPVAEPRSELTRWIATYRAWGQAQVPIRQPEDSFPPDPVRHFAGNVALLTSARTYSAAEDMVVLYATSKRGLLIGEPTGGSTGQPLSFLLPAGGTARICTKHDTFPDGHEFVGIGVPPDVTVYNTREDIAAHRDRVLETAIARLSPSHGWPDKPSDREPATGLPSAFNDSP